MINLSISRAWNQTMAFVAREAGLLMPVAFAFVGLPSVILGQFTPSMAPDQTPEPGPWMLAIIPMVILSIAGGLTLNNLVLRPGISVGEAIRLAMPRILPLVGAALLLVLAGMVASIPVLMLAAALSGGNVAAGTGIALFLMVPLFILVGVRLMFMNPVAAMEGAGPLAIVSRSWKLTRGQFFKLFMMFVAFFVVLMVASIALSSIFGIVVTVVIGSPSDEPIAKLILELVSAVLSTVFSVYLSTMIAHLYAQVSAPRT